MLVLLFVALLLFVYPFAIYPAMVRLLPRWRPARPAAGGAGEPRLVMVICALNEQKIIRAKLENCLELDWPRGQVRVVVVSDGSTDATAAIAREFAGRGVELIEREQRRGKIANLNVVVPALEEEVVVLSDANVLYHAAALRHLLARLEDPEVGCVSGKVVLTDSAPELDAPTGGYYSIEWMLQERASAIYSMPGADGAMYAFRRELFRPCPPDTLIEDFVIPMSVLRQGRRVVFAPEALGWERGPANLSEEFRRKVRIAAGAAQALLRGNGWPRDAPLRFWLVFVSHKLLRWLSPLTGLAALALAIACIHTDLGRLVLAGFLATATLAGVRLLTGWAHLAVSGPFYFLFGQAALAMGLLKGVLRRQSVLWAKADR